MMPDFVFGNDDWKSHFVMRNIAMLHCRIISQYKKIISALWNITERSLNLNN